MSKIWTTENSTVKFLLENKQKQINKQKFHKQSKKENVEIVQGN